MRRRGPWMLEKRELWKRRMIWEPDVGVSHTPGGRGESEDIPL